MKKEELQELVEEQKEQIKQLKETNKQLIEDLDKFGMVKELNIELQSKLYFAEKELKENRCTINGLVSQLETFEKTFKVLTREE
jgi:phage-related minor tail protein